MNTRFGLRGVSAIVAAAVTVLCLAPASLAQIADEGGSAFDAPARVVEAPPVVPMDPDLWRVALAQRSLYESVFASPWRWDDFSLFADAPMVDQFAEASGVTTGGEAFGVYVEFVSVFDWEHMVWGGEPLTPDELALIDSYDLRMSYMWGHLTGPAGSAPFGGLAASFVIDGVEYHKLYPWMKLTPEEAEAVAFAAEFRGWPVCNLPYDQEYLQCTDRALDNFGCRIGKAKAVGLIGGGVATVTGLVCCGTTIVPNPIGVTCCVGTMAALLYGGVCVSTNIVAAGQDLKNSFSCCCIALTCRTNGGSNCGSTENCNSAGCGDTPCVP